MCGEQPSLLPSKPPVEGGVSHTQSQGLEGMQGRSGGEDPPLPQLSLVSPNPHHSRAPLVLVGKALPAPGPRSTW